MRRSALHDDSSDTRTALAPATPVSVARCLWDKVPAKLPATSEPQQHLMFVLGIYGTLFHRRERLASNVLCSWRSTISALRSKFNVFGSSDQRSAPLAAHTRTPIHEIDCDQWSWWPALCHSTLHLWSPTIPPAFAHGRSSSMFAFSAVTLSLSKQRGDPLCSSSLCEAPHDTHHYRPALLYNRTRSGLYSWSFRQETAVALSPLRHPCALSPLSRLRLDTCWTPRAELHIGQLMGSHLTLRRTLKWSQE